MPAFLLAIGIGRIIKSTGVADAFLRQNQVKNTRIELNQCARLKF
tara:strand:- start:27374 stop:27508 length:135 start_codon:yes stop_codon:yes gene_type:complete